MIGWSLALLIAPGRPASTDSPSALNVVVVLFAVVMLPTVGAILAILRPGNPIVEKLYYAYLRFCLWFTGFLFRSGPAALNCKKYFIQALQMFYSAQELSDMLEEVGFRDVTATTVFSGMLGFHRAVKPPPA